MGLELRGRLNCTERKLVRYSILHLVYFTAGQGAQINSVPHSYPGLRMPDSVSRL